MRRKPVPPTPDDPSFVSTVRAAVPLVPRDEESCCVRLVDRTPVPAEDEARTWLTFLAALGLTEETDAGFVRTRDPADPGREWLASAYRDGVYGVEELLESLDPDEPTAEDAAFEAFRDHVPTWERHRSEDWERDWRRRVARLLAWAVLFGLVERRADGYVLAGE